MDEQRRQLKLIILLMLLMLGVICSTLISSQRSLTGINDLDGIIGVVLGLFICSHPAANLVDLFFYKRGVRGQFSSSRSIVLWIALNTLVLLIGGIVIFTGTTRFIGRTG